MGLGKTVQMIATMTLNAADPYSDGPRATLIVVPVALLHQVRLFCSQAVMQDTEGISLAVEGRNRNQDKRYVPSAYSTRAYQIKICGGAGRI